MKKIVLTVVSLCAIATISFLFQGFAPQNDEPWTKDQLMPPADLAKTINANSGAGTYVFDIGPAGQIKNSIIIGAASEEDNLQQLQEEVSKLPKDANIVIYCGCCPFKNCPNIRPAFSLLNDMNFTNHKLLYLPQNLKVDWIDKGFPMEN